MFNNNNETNDDDDFFVPITSSSSSNLANLFGTHNRNSNSTAQDLNSSLTYTPPKQPPKTKSNQLTQQTTKDEQKKLVFAKTITLSRLISESNYSIIGKFGIAIIADHISTDLIIYKTKQNILSSTKIFKAFKYKQVKELVISFIDGQAETWMVSFDCSKDNMDFVREMAKQGVEIPEKPLGDISNPTKSDSRSLPEEPEVDIDHVQEDQVRADILGRISKMGLSILPTSETPLPTLPTSNANASSLKKVLVDKELSESEPEEVIRATKFKKVRGRHSESSLETMNLVPKTPGTPAGPYGGNVQHVSIGHHQLMDPLNIYFTENRTHNSEVRMNLTQLSSKIDNLLSELRPQPSLVIPNDRELLERRISELEKRLDNQPSSSNGRVGMVDKLEVESKIAELQKANSQNVLKYNDTITALTTEIETLKNYLDLERNSRATEKCSWEQERINLEQVSQNYKEKVAELETLIENQQLKLQDFTAHFQQQQSDDKLTRDKKEKEEMLKYELMQETIDDLQQKLQDAELQFNQLLQSRCNEEDLLTKVVKTAMNTMYENVLSDSMDSTTNITNVRDFKKILQKHLRSTTFDIIYQFVKCCKDLDSKTSSLSSVSPEFEVTV